MENKNAILIGFTIPNSEAVKIFTIDKSPAVQTHKFAWSLARSISAAGFNLSLISASPIQNYPAGNKIFFFPKKFLESNILGQQIFFVNLLILKHISRLISTFLVGLISIIKKDIKYVFIHGIHSPFIFFGFICRMLKIKVIVILTDPPGVILPNDGFILAKLKKIDAFFLKLLIGNMSGVIALSKYLSESYAPKIPSLIFPGIVNKDLINKINSLNPESKINKKFTIAYAGGLNKIYGVDALLEAVIKYTSTPVILNLYGRGDQEDKISSLAEKNDNIVYKGFLDPDKLVEELMTADLLINPRQSNGYISIESFPSKLIEYLALGKPVLTTKIQSIPNEYQHLFYYIDDESPAGIAKAIDFVANLNKDETINLGSKSKNFIISNASEEKIGRKIADFAKSLS